MDKLENNIARYPIGFRHLENFNNYRTIYTDATIEDYHNYSKNFIFYIIDQ